MRRRKKCRCRACRVLALLGLLSVARAQSTAWEPDPCKDRVNPEATPMCAKEADVQPYKGGGTVEPPKAAKKSIGKFPKPAKPPKTVTPKTGNKKWVI